MAEGGDLPDLEMHAENLTMDDDDDDDDNSEDWNEVDADMDSHIVCLFCKHQFKTMAVALEHCKMEHKFYLTGLKTKFNMDCYSYIRLINFIRKENVAAEVIMNSNDPIWLSDDYLVPVIQDDSWLMFDFEGLESPFQSEAVTPDDGYHVVNAENGLVTLSEQSFSHLRLTIQTLTSQLRAKDEALAQAFEQINHMKSVTQNLFTADSTADVEQRIIPRFRYSEDSDYFYSYSHIGIHHEMLSDKVRMSSYHDAMVGNPEVMAGTTVLDVGCGTGILSMFAAKAGATKVFGVDQSDIVYQAMDVIRENGLSDKVELVKGAVENVNLPVDKVDVIVSEWMGYFLLFEGMLDSLISARDRFLKPGGVLLPNRCSICLFGISDEAKHNEMLGLWQNVFGFKMTCLGREMFREAFVTDVPMTAVASTIVPVLQLDLLTCDIASTCFSTDFSLEVIRNCKLTGIGGCFDTFFDLKHSVVLSTSPLKDTTHWKQTVFYFKQPLDVTEGEILTANITCERPKNNARALRVKLKIELKARNFEDTYTYDMM